MCIMSGVFDPSTCCLLRVDFEGAICIGEGMIEIKHACKLHHGLRALPVARFRFSSPCIISQPSVVALPVLCCLADSF